MVAWSQAVMHIPWWVFLLVLYVCKMGIQATRSSVVPIKKLIITPVIFAYLSVHSLLTQPTLTFLQIGSWTAAVAIGGFLGWRLVMGLNLQFDKAQQLVRLPGTWSTLIVMLCIFAGKFYMGYEISQGESNAFLGLIALMVSGCGTGVVCGRVLGYFVQFMNSSSVSLTE